MDRNVFPKSLKKINGAEWRNRVILQKKMINKLVGLLLILVSNVIEAKPPVIAANHLLSPPSNIIRTCCSFGSNVSVARVPFLKKTDIISFFELNNHTYLGGNEEGNGIIYTHKGGFIDIGHLRDFADWTAYLYTIISYGIDNQKSLELNLGKEGGLKMLTINSSDLITATQRLELAGKIAFDISLWHEIATWFGTSYIPLVPERYSSFSPEDLNSNLLGIKIGILAIESEMEFDEAMTIILSEELIGLGAVATYEETALAMEEVQDVWWTRKKALPSKDILLKRYFDSDTNLVPWLLPSSASTPFLLEKFESELNKYYQFSIQINSKIPEDEIWLNEIVETIDQNDFHTMMDYILSIQNELKYKINRNISKSRIYKSKHKFYKIKHHYNSTGVEFYA